MRKQILNTLILIGLVLSGFAQKHDLIVTTKNDSIHCTITALDSTKVFYKVTNTTLSLDRKDISSLFMPILPTDQVRLSIEKDIKKYQDKKTSSAFLLIFGIVSIGLGVLSIGYSVDQLFHVGGSLSDFENYLILGPALIAVGIPSIILGTRYLYLNGKKLKQSKKQLESMYLLSLNVNYTPFYKGLTLVYHF
jgi:hypothetical protein